MIITKKSIPRRTVLRGLGVTLALPLLDGMVPALTAVRFNPALKALYDRLIAQGRPRLVAIGAAMRKLLMIAYGEIQSDRVHLHHPEICYVAGGFRVTPPVATMFHPSTSSRRMTSPTFMPTPRGLT